MSKQDRDERYNEQRPTITWRMPYGKASEIKALIKQAGWNKQQFVDQLYEEAYDRVKTKVTQSQTDDR